MKEFVETARKYDLKVGIYYSWLEFGKGITVNFLNTVVVPQMRELEEYRPDYFWFDGDWELKSQVSQRTILGIVQSLQSQGIKVNSRIGDKAGENELGNASYKVFGDRTIPGFIPNFKWEYIFTIGSSWGRNKQQQAGDYLSGDQIKALYDQVRSKNGRFLINFGPDGEGQLDPYEIQSFTDFISLIE